MLLCSLLWLCSLYTSGQAQFHGHVEHFHTPFRLYTSVPSYNPMYLCSTFSNSFPPVVSIPLSQYRPFKHSPTLCLNASCQEAMLSTSIDTETHEIAVHNMLEWPYTRYIHTRGAHAHKHTQHIYTYGHLIRLNTFANGWMASWIEPAECNENCTGVMRLSARSFQKVIQDLFCLSPMKRCIIS